MSFHFLSGNNYGAYADTGPGSIIVDSLATIETSGAVAEAALTLGSGPWTVNINGEISGDDAHGLVVYDEGNFVSNVSIGKDGDIAASGNSAIGIYFAHAAKVANAGHVSGQLYGIELFHDANFNLSNARTGEIASDNTAIDIAVAGTHTVKNAGLIGSSDIAIRGGDGVERIINWGRIDGDVFLGGGNDIVTNFKQLGHTIKNGSVDGIIDLGAGDDIFNGGNTREVVKDHFGRDTYNFGGGNDHFVGYLNGSDDRTDKIDGGKGIDAYDASQAGVLGVFINLDTISHYDFIRDVDLAALRADDLFNAATAADKILSIENAYGSSGDDSVFGTKAANELAGGDGFDILYGLAGNDRLLGGDATDALVGGAGRDELWGGADGAADVFIFRSLKDSGPTQATRDTIKDFGVGDTIDLHAINDKLGDVITGFLGVDVAFTGHKGDLRAVTSGDNTIVQLDVNGDKKADCTIQLDGHIALTIDDFNL